MFTYIMILLFQSALPTYVNGEIIVRFYQPLTKSQSGYELPMSFNQRFGVYEISPLLQGRIDELDKKYGFDRTYLVRFDTTKENRENFINLVFSIRDVEFAEPNYLYKLYRTPNDDLFPSQWNLQKIQSPDGWDMQIGDPRVVIAIVDAGCDTAHPDLNANLWRNSDEILNGLDSDGNGYVDDIVGWDWTGNDNDPTPEYFGFPGWPPDEDHGTWCNGIANAVTDNGSGIAGVGWNVCMMGLRCTATNQPGLIDTYRAINAIHYARQNGARVISCSWGGYNSNSSTNSAIQQAHEAGLVICAAAGNDRSEQIHYPAGYDNVIAVGGTDQQDRSWYCGTDCGTNYGYWVDVCAPSVSVYGCDPGGDGSYDYESASGTSGSSPQVAGLAALLFSRYPDSSNTFIENTIFETCDPINDTLYEQEKLGYGRINVFKALGKYEYSWIKLCNFRTTDSNNNRPEPGETCRLYISLTNKHPWSDASDVTVSVHSLCPQVVFTDSIATFREVTGDTVENEDEIIFQVGDMSPARVNIVATYREATPPSYHLSDTLSLLIGFPLLLVDDDEGACYEDKYTDALNALNIVYEYWSVKDSGNPSSNLLYHPVVIWFTGDDSITSLTSNERSSISLYLEGGGKLFITGQNIAQNLAGDPFLSDWLGCNFISSPVSGNYVTGIPGDEVGDGLNILTAFNQTSRDKINPTATTDSVLEYSDGVYAAVKYQDGERKVVFFSFGFEGIIDHSSYSSKREVMERVLQWLDPDLFGVEEQEDSGFNSELVIYPNPASSKIVFTLPAGTNITPIKIYDIAGREVDSFTSQIRKFKYNVESLSPGIYFYRVEGRKKEQGKFVVVR